MSLQVIAQAQKQPQPQPHAVNVSERTVLAAEQVALRGAMELTKRGNTASAAIEGAVEVMWEKFRGVGVGETGVYNN